MRNYWEVKAKADRVGELILYGDISNSQIWGDEVTPAQIDSELKALGEIDILNVFINSGGGSISAGQAIASIIKRHNAAVKNAYIDGFCGSIATMIPNACDKVYMVANGIYVIHKPWGSFTGNATEIRKNADNMDKCEEIMIDSYQEKTKISREKLTEMLEAETWMTAKEALNYGFVDEIEGKKLIAASIDGAFLLLNNQKFDTTKYANFKAELVETYGGVIQPIVIKDQGPGRLEEKKLDLAEQEKNNNRIREKILGGI